MASNFLQRFGDKISVVHRDGTIAKPGQPSEGAVGAASGAAHMQKRVVPRSRPSPRPDEGSEYTEQPDYGNGYAPQPPPRQQAGAYGGAEGAYEGEGYGYPAAPSYYAYQAPPQPPPAQAGAYDAYYGYAEAAPGYGPPWGAHPWGGVPKAKAAVAGAGGYARLHRAKQRREAGQKESAPPPPPEPEYATPEEKLAFSRKPREVAYRPYTLKEYEALKQAPLAMGSLGPEPPDEELLAKRAMKERMRDYGDEMNKANIERLVREPPKRRPPPPGWQPPKPPSGRDRVRRRGAARAAAEGRQAVEYARQVPRPKARAAAREEEEYGGEEEEEVGELERLAAKHRTDQEAVEAIRRELQRQNLRSVPEDSSDDDARPPGPDPPAPGPRRGPASEGSGSAPPGPRRSGVGSSGSAPAAAGRRAHPARGSPSAR